MPQKAWSDKRERQYEHIKEGLCSQRAPWLSAAESRVFVSLRSSPDSFVP